MDIMPDRLSHQLDHIVASLTEQKLMAEDIDDTDGLTPDGRRAYNDLKNVIALLAVASRIDPDTMDKIYHFGFQSVERDFINIDKVAGLLREDHR